MKLKRIVIFSIVTTFTVIIFSCKKSDWLDISSSKALNVPTTLADFQAILDNDLIMNQSYPVIGQMGTDNVFIPEASFVSLTGLERNAYIWSEDVYEGRRTVTDWDQPYKIIAYSNIVLDGLNKIASQDTDAQRMNNIKGGALFFRAFAFYNLAQLFCKPYYVVSASSDPGILLRLTSDVNISISRASVKETYDRIIEDLQLAETLLPVSEMYITRPSRAAACALLAKVYLLMQDYENARDYANKVLAINDSLLDFKTLSTTSSSPFPAVANGTTPNTEIIFYARGIIYNSMRARGAVSRIDTELFKQYMDADLRKDVLYTQSGNYWVFKGTYSGGAFTALFTGLATNEIYLIRAECYARLNNVPASLADLNTLLQSRHKNGFVSLTAEDSEQALVLVLNERRKELPLTSQVRWEDLRRLNQDSRFSLTLNRIIENDSFSLAPEDIRYVLPIPDYEIQLSNIPQNER